jgi:signal peptidase I
MAAPSTHSPHRPPGELFPDEDLGVKGPSTGRVAVEWIIVVAAAVAAALLIKTFALQAFFIPSASMEPTLRGGDGGKPGDRVLVDKVSYRVRDISRGDVIVFHAPPNFDHPTITELIKRVIALPGDEVVFENGRVKLNGQFIAEPYLTPNKVTMPVPEGAGSYDHRCLAEDPCKIPAGYVWVMGDNRTDSEDSRWVGPIAQELVVGKAFVLIWPFNRFSGL